MASSPKPVRKSDKSKGPSKLVGTVLLLVGLATLPLAYNLVDNGTVRLSGRIRANDLKTYSSRLDFTSRYFVLVASWLVINVLYAITRRVKTGVADPTVDQPEPILVANNILRNSIDQAIIIVLAQLALIPFLTGSQTIKFIPLINIVWFAGRVTFFLGYPGYRGFGWAWTFAPALGTIGYTLHLFATKHMQLY